MADDKRTQQATLGCGTFILIALTVLFFSRPGIEGVEQEMRLLRAEVGEMNKTLQSQAAEIGRLSDKLNKKQP